MQVIGDNGLGTGEEDFRLELIKYNPKSPILNPKNVTEIA
jgi:hypothetical protein